jgi:hypothetical protein
MAARRARRRRTGQRRPGVLFGGGHRRVGHCVENGRMWSVPERATLDQASHQKGFGMASSPSVFVSHTSSDKKRLVAKLARDLRDGGAQVFYDEWSIRPAQRLRDKISDAIRGCTHFLIILSRRSVRSNWVKNELDQAMILRIRGFGPEILPVVFGRVVLDDIPLDLAGLRWVTFKAARGPQYEQGLLDLLKALNLTGPNPVASLEEIRAKQRIFIREHLAGTLPYDLFWLFWNKPMVAGNWDKLLYIIKEQVLARQFEEARTNTEVLIGMLQYYGITIETPPRMITELILHSESSGHGLLIGWMIQLANFFRVLLVSCI